MVRWVFFVLLLVTALFAETQQEAYYRAMKAEEAGDIAAALKAFEEAAALPGPYTEELLAIIRDYNDALGITGDVPASPANPWEFHVAGELGLYGLHYKETGMDEGEIGGEVFLNVNPYWDYTAGSLSHTFGASVQASYFMNNDVVTVLDSNDVTFVLGFEYKLMMRSFFLDVSYELNIQGSDLSSDFYVGAEKNWLRFEKQRVSTMAWAYYNTTGPMVFALYGAWYRTVVEGLNGTVYAGVKYTADSIYDYKSYFRSYYASKEDSTVSAGNLVYSDVLWKWLGPVLNTRVSYKFKNRISVDAFANLFYGFAVDGPDEDYEKFKKFNAIYGVQVSWKHWVMLYYLGLERNVKRMSIPQFGKGIYSERTAITKLKLGVMWDY